METFETTETKNGTSRVWTKKTKKFSEKNRGGDVKNFSIF